MEKSREELIESIFSDESLDGEMSELNKKVNEGLEDKSIIVLNGVNINLKQLGINFILNEQQKECLNRIAYFLEKSNKESIFTLSGYAGTGKSSIVKILLRYIQLRFGYNYSYEITAPTNRAKYVIETLSNRKSKTLHSVLGLMPNIELEKLDVRKLKFDTRKAPQLPKHLLMVDECSMVNDFLNDTIVSKCEANNTKIIYIGDKAQLKPVQQADISKTFNYPGYELTKVERQKDGNPLGYILLDIRSNPYSDNPTFEFENNLNSKGEGIEFIDNSSSFLNNAFESIKNVVYYTEYLNSRIVVFQNARVALYNKLIRGKLGFDKEYHKGELLMAYDNVGNNEYSEGIINSCDYIIENDPVKKERMILDCSMQGYNVNLVSTDGKNRITQFILSTDNVQSEFEDLAFKIEELRQSAIFCKEKYKKSSLWKEYYSVTESFLTPVPLYYSTEDEKRQILKKSIDYGYAMTCHKSQGGTFTDIYVDYRDFMTCRDIQQRNQLLYVGLSRCTNKATMFF